MDLDKDIEEKEVPVEVNDELSQESNFSDNDNLDDDRSSEQESVITNHIDGMSIAVSNISTEAYISDSNDNSEDDDNNSSNRSKNSIVFI